jgi:hypothetical protein
MQSRIESKNLMMLQAAGNLLRGLLQLYCRQQLLLAALLICSGSSGFLIGCAAGRSSDDSSVMGSFTSLRTVHKYSESAREIMLERYGDDHPAASWPVQGSVEYYQLLRNHDEARLAAAASGSRRNLLSTASTPPTSYTFAEGNETEKFSDFFYAFIDIGTPRVEYFVALDTATDLLWVPCECQQCAPLSAPGTGDNRTVRLPSMLKLLFLLRQKSCSRLCCCIQTYFRSEVFIYATAQEPSGSLDRSFCFLLQEIAPPRDIFMLK